MKGLTIKGITWSRKKTLIAGSVLLLALAGVYATLSIFAWSNYEQSYTLWHSNVKAEFDAAMKLSTEPADQKSKWLDALDATAQPMQQDKCSPGALYGWQASIMPALKNNVASCKKLQTAMSAFNSSLTSATKSIRAEEVIAGILNEPLKNTTVNDTAYQAQVDAWAKVGTSLNGSEVPDEVAGVKLAAISAADAIKTAWSALMAANTAQNASQYQAALNGLSTAYNGLSAVSTESHTALQKVADRLQMSYDATF